MNGVIISFTVALVKGKNNDLQNLKIYVINKDDYGYTISRTAPKNRSRSTPH